LLSSSSSSSRESSPERSRKNNKNRKKSKNRKSKEKSNLSDQSSSSSQDSEPDSSSDDDDLESPVKTRTDSNDSYLKLLLRIRDRIQELEDSDVLAKVIKEIEKSKNESFQTTNCSYIFDLLKLDRQTVVKVGEMIGIKEEGT